MEQQTIFLQSMDHHQNGVKWIWRLWMNKIPMKIKIEVMEGLLMIAWKIVNKINFMHFHNYDHW